MKQIINQLYRLAYKIAFPLGVLAFRILGIQLRGVFVFIWCDGKLLVVKNSYKAYHSLPGGLLKKGEEPDLGAIRETEEEVGVLLSAERLIMHEPIIDQFGGIAYIAEIYLDQQPAISIDQREIVWADFVSREDALSMVLAEEVRDWLISHPDAGMR